MSNPRGCPAKIDKAKKGGRRHSSALVCAAAIALHLGAPRAAGQTNNYLYTGSEQLITLFPGKYNITVYGAEGSYGGDRTRGGLGAEMEGQFTFGTTTNLTALIGGAGLTDSGSGGGGGGTFIFGGGTPLVIAGGGGGCVDNTDGGPGLTGTSGGGGGGSYAGGGGSSGNGGGGGQYIFGGGGGGGGSYIASSAVMVVKEISGAASPDSSPNGEIVITAVQVPLPSSLPLFVSRSGKTITLYWQNEFGWSLQQSVNPASSSWSARTSGITTLNGTNYLNVTSPRGNLFFRLAY